MIKKRHFLIVMGILLIGLIVGSFLDLQINQAIFSDRNGFGIAMAAFGTLPCYGGLAFLGGALLSKFTYSVSKKSYFKRYEWERPICFIGRHSLIIYATHFIVLVGIFSLVGVFIK